MSKCMSSSEVEVSFSPIQPFKFPVGRWLSSTGSLRDPASFHPVPPPPPWAVFSARPRLGCSHTLAPAHGKGTKSTVGGGGCCQGEALLTSPQAPLGDSVTWMSLTAEEAGKYTAAGRPPAHRCSILLEGGDIGFVGHLTACAIEVDKDFRSCAPYFYFSSGYS